MENEWTASRRIYWGLVFFVGDFFFSMFFYDETLYFKTGVTLIMALFALIVALKADRNERYLDNSGEKFNKRVFICYIALWGFLSIFIISNIIAVSQTKYVFISALMSLASSIFEESIGRGLFLSGFIKFFDYRDSAYVLTKATIFSTLLYSGIYLLNIIFVAPQIIFQQAICLILIGIILGVFRIKTNSLWGPIVIHFILSWGSLGLIVDQSLLNWLLLALLYLPLALFSLFYLRRLDQKNTAVSR